MNSEGLCEITTVVRPLSSADLHESNYPLDDGEYEVPVRGRTGEKRSRASAHLTNEGTVRIDCAENLDFWAELDLPKEYIMKLAKRFDEEEEKMRIESGIEEGMILEETGMRKGNFRASGLRVSISQIQ